LPRLEPQPEDFVSVVERRLRLVLQAFQPHLSELPELIFVCVRQQRQQRHLGLFDDVGSLTVANLTRAITITHSARHEIR
jgi:hypothetical protein